MKLQEGWLKQQIETASAEVNAWPPIKREIMLCPSEAHSWDEEQRLSEDSVLQVCKNCDRQRVRFDWAEGWMYVKRGEERA